MVTSPSKAFGGGILIDNLLTTLALVESEASASLGFSWAVNISIKFVIFSKKLDMRTLASWGATTGGALLGASEDSPSAKLDVGSP